MGRTDWSAEVVVERELGGKKYKSGGTGRCLGTMHDNNLEMTDRVKARTEGLEWVAWPRGPSLTDNAKM
jgi:hypothetical protein